MSRAPWARRIYHLCPKDSSTCWSHSIHFNSTLFTPLLLAWDSLGLPLLIQGHFLEEVFPDFCVIPTWLQLSPFLPCFPLFSSAPRPLRADLLRALMGFQGVGERGGE